MDKLDQLVDAYISNQQKIINNRAPAKDKDELLNALREKLKQEVMQEIKDKFEDEIIAEASEKIQKNANREKLNQLTGLMWNGFLLAFFVGLAVNQVTEIINYYNRTLFGNSLWFTLIISLILIVLCIALYACAFAKYVIETYRELTKKH